MAGVKSNRSDPPPELVGAVLEKMRYISDQRELWKMYEEVLAKSIDKDQADLIHPAFGHLISQLSRDEAWVLYRLRDRAFKVVDKLDLIANRFENRAIETSELPVSELLLPAQIELYYSHLESLSLVTWPVLKQDPIMDSGTQIGLRRHSTMMLTDFGRLFVKSCIPLDGFPTMGQSETYLSP